MEETRRFHKTQKATIMIIIIIPGKRLVDLPGSLECNLHAKQVRHTEISNSFTTTLPHPSVDGFSQDYSIQITEKESFKSF